MTTILHKIRAWLYDNLLSQDNANDYVARVIAERSLNIAEICESAVDRGGADVSAAAMEHATNLFFKEMGYLLCDGFSVNTGWFTASVHVRGVFDSPTETFNPQKHTLLFEFHQGATLRKELEQITVDVLGVAESGFLIGQVTDIKTGSVNDLLTPGRNLKIVGHKIKVAGEAPACGVLFIPHSGGPSVKVDPSDIVVNNPSELIVVIPQLESRKYFLQITTQFSGNSKAPLKEPRHATFDKLLTVP